MTPMAIGAGPRFLVFRIVSELLFSLPWHGAREHGGAVINLLTELELTWELKRRKIQQERVWSPSPRQMAWWSHKKKKKSSTELVGGTGRSNYGPSMSESRVASSHHLLIPKKVGHLSLTGRER